MSDNEPASWPEAATRLGVPLLSPGDHRQRWRDSLDPWSTFTRALRLGIEGVALMEFALDAAAGISHEAERLQRACLGPAWKRRQREFLRHCKEFGLPLDPPPGFSHDAWLAISAVMATGASDWSMVPESLGPEVKLLAHLQRTEPAEYERLADAVTSAAQALDGTARRRLLKEKEALDTAAVFRTGWQRAFGEKAGIRPKAPFHLAVVIIWQASKDTRVAGLFAHHLGLTQTNLSRADPVTLPDVLMALDNEVHNARKVWRRLVEKPKLRAGAFQLCELIEWATHEEILAGKVRAGEPTSEPGL